MNKITASKTLNRCLGGDDELYCARVYRNARISCYGWLETEWLINLTFWIIRKERNHCKAAFVYEKRQRRRHETKSKSAEAQKSQTSHSSPRQDALEELSA